MFVKENIVRILSRFKRKDGRGMNLKMNMKFETTFKTTFQICFQICLIVCHFWFNPNVLLHLATSCWLPLIVTKSVTLGCCPWRRHLTQFWAGTFYYKFVSLFYRHRILISSLSCSKADHFRWLMGIHGDFSSKNPKLPIKPGSFSCPIITHQQWYFVHGSHVYHISIIDGFIPLNSINGWYSIPFIDQPIKETTIVADISQSHHHLSYFIPVQQQV